MHQENYHHGIICSMGNNLNISKVPTTRPLSKLSSDLKAFNNLHLSSVTFFQSNLPDYFWSFILNLSNGTCIKLFNVTLFDLKIFPDLTLKMGDWKTDVFKYHNARTGFLWKIQVPKIHFFNFKTNYYGL